MFERLTPTPGPVTVSELAAGERTRRPTRPWVGVCMVASLDGAVAVGERSTGLSGPSDQALLGALRAIADVVLVGAGTVRLEGYGAPKREGLRIGVVTGTGDVDTTGDLFSGGAGFLVMPEDGPPAPMVDGRPVDTVRAGRGRVDVPGALARLEDVVDTVTFVHVEGGPGLNASLFDADAVDELNLTISPRVAGGASPRVVAGAAEHLRDFDLAQLARDDESFLFGRWVRRPR